jgi:hypothetical protein
MFKLLYSPQRRRERKVVYFAFAGERPANENPQALRAVYLINFELEKDQGWTRWQFSPKGCCFSLSVLSTESEKENHSASSASRAQRAVKFNLPVKR